MSLTSLAVGIGILLPLGVDHSFSPVVSAALVGSTFFMIPSAVTTFSRKNLPPAHWGRAVSLFTVFSSGGAENNDLPEDSSYRSVTPMACTISYKDGKSEVKPFVIDYKSFNDASRNAFYQEASGI